MSERRFVLHAAGFILLASVLVTVATMERGEGPVYGVHISGDWPEALGVDVPRAALDEARVRVVMLTSWDKLRHVEEAAFLCGAACEARPGPRVVRVIGLRAPRVTKDVLIRLAWDAVDGPGPRDLACAAGVIEAEASGLLPDVPCWDVDTRWRLPFGLGVWG